MTTGRSSIRRNLFATVSLAIMALMLPGVPAAGLNTAAGPLDATFEAHGGLKQWRSFGPSGEAKPLDGRSVQPLQPH
jgi:hypothetical protein